MSEKRALTLKRGSVGPDVMWTDVATVEPALTVWRYKRTLNSEDIPEVHLSVKLWSVLSLIILSGWRLVTGLMFRSPSSEFPGPEIPGSDFLSCSS